MKYWLLKIRRILSQIIMCPLNPYYKAFILHYYKSVPYYKAFTSRKNWRSFLHKFFHENSLIVACCTFGRLEIRTLTLNGFKSQTMTLSNYLATITAINNGLLHWKLSVVIVLLFTYSSKTVLSWSLFWIHIMNAIVISEDYIHNSPITKTLFDKKNVSFCWR